MMYNFRQEGTCERDKRYKPEGLVSQISFHSPDSGSARKRRSAVFSFKTIKSLLTASTLQLTCIYAYGEGVSMPARGENG